MRFEWKKTDIQKNPSSVLSPEDHMFFGILKTQGQESAYHFRLKNTPWPDPLTDQYSYFFKQLKTEGVAPSDVQVLLAASTKNKSRAGEFISALKKFGIQFQLKEITGSSDLEVKLDFVNFAILKREKKSEQKSEHNQKTRVLIVEDSLPVQKILKKVYSELPGVEIIDCVPSWKKALEIYQEQKPDFVSLDMNLSDGLGLEFIKAVKNLNIKPLPRIVLVTDCNIESGNLVLDALSLGAQSYVQKPHFSDLAQFQTEIQGLISALFSSKSQRKIQTRPADSGKRKHFKQFKLIAIGSSTGGTEIVRDLLAGMPKDSPPVMIVQHMPKNFTGLYAERLSKQTNRPVIEVTQTTPLEKGSAYLASGNLHLVLQEKRGQMVAEIDDSPHVNRFKPSVSVLFKSITKTKIAAESLAIMLTGMGHDGAQEMRELKDLGAYTITQSEESCAVYGMPRAADECGASCWSANPDEMINYFQSSQNLPHQTRAS